MIITAEPRSDQWNADDFIGGPITFTIAGVKVGTAEQKYDIELVEGGGRAWRPPLTMLRLLIAAWGKDSTAWKGRRVTLYRDESVRFGSDAVGGIRISHLSHLPGDKTLTVKLTSTRGRKAVHTVDPLPAAPAPAPAPGAPKGGGKSLTERVDAVVAAFAGMGVTLAQLESRLDLARDGWGAEHIETLTALGKSIKGDQTTVEAEFPTESTEQQAEPPGDDPADPADPADAAMMAGPTELKKLAEIRKAERYDDDESWFAYVQAATGVVVSRDDQLTLEQAERLIDIYNEDTAK